MQACAEKRKKGRPELLDSAEILLNLEQAKLGRLKAGVENGQMMNISVGKSQKKNYYGNKVKPYWVN